MQMSCVFCHLTDGLYHNKTGWSQDSHATVHIFLEVFKTFIETMLLFLPKKTSAEIEIIQAVL